MNNKEIFELEVLDLLKNKIPSTNNIMSLSLVFNSESRCKIDISYNENENINVELHDYVFAKDVLSLCKKWRIFDDTSKVQKLEIKLTQNYPTVLVEKIVI